MPERTAIVTGASSGIGLEVARGLVERGHHVVLGVRDLAKGVAAAKEIGGGEAIALDLADHASVRTFAQAFLARYERLDVLVNNAGIHTARAGLSPQGHELTIATNHLGHFLLTALLLDVLKKSAPSRVVNVASEAHRGARRVDLAGEVQGVGMGGTSPVTPSGLRAYTQSKLANIMFTYALARRLEGAGVSAFAVHPGSVASGWARGGDSGVFRLATWLARPFMISPAEGARTPLYAATSPELDGKTGLYLVREKPARSNAASYDIEAQERLWRESEKLVG